ncbi:uncharacterized protein LOC127282137 [Leptopilina boulardi]|uniref:uncharacterized protein LOC127282137 n=1 Tax=Leptopilina boulardi TaxID=63433 RepID=UPI0021F6232E|nr:uncharacterized protein LOC127282137 [Leptopilina boulardi]
MPELEELRQTRTNCKTRLTKFKTYIEKCTNENFNDIVDVEELKLRLAKIEETWDIYDRTQSKLEILVPNPNRETERMEFEDNYFRLCAVASKLIKERSATFVTSRFQESEVDQGHNRERIAQLEAALALQRENELATLRELTASRGSSIHSGSHFPLPKLDLPTFTGDYKDWLGFKDAFKAIIHEDASIPKIQKLRYLRAYVKDNAAKVIDNLSTSDNNYNVAWDLLNERYNNERIIIQNHMQSIFELPNANRDSSFNLRNLVDSMLRHVRALNVLGQPTDSWDTPLICLITGKLDRDTRTEWEKSVTGSAMPTFECFSKFLKTRCEILETIKSDSNNQIEPLKSTAGGGSHTHTNRRNLSKAFVNTQGPISCPMCSENHYIQNCQQFTKLSTDERVQIVKKKGLCFNCFRRNHRINECRCSNCTICGRKHHTLLHAERDKEKIQNSDSSSNVKNMHVLDASRVLLSTANIGLFDTLGNSHSCRILLDSGSQPNLITEECVTRLRLKKRKFDSSIEGVNNNAIKSAEWVDVKFKSHVSGYAGRLSFMVLPHITSHLPNFPINKDNLSIPSQIQLSDPSFHKPGKIDALVGGEIFYELLQDGKIPLAAPRLYLQSTKLGWIVVGKVGVPGSSSLRCHMVRDSLSEQVEKFWKLENIEERCHKSEEEITCEEHFVSNFRRMNDGKYMVSLPFTDKLQELGSSFEIAARRFFTLEKRLERNPDLKIQYHEFMKTYLDLGHMQPVETKKEEGYFIPHQAVIRESSLSTILRVVFDASSETSTGISLNDVMRAGPIIQDGIFELMLRIRQHPIVLGADIEKMFRQFWVEPADRKFQKILWRFNSSEPVSTYELNTITYGTSAAPFLAVRCLKQLADDEEERFPIAALVLREDFFVDDMLTGAETMEEAVEIRDQIIGITNAAGLRLSKWTSNCYNLIEDLPNTIIKMRVNLDKEHSSTSRMLGVCWNPEEDTLLFEINQSSEKQLISKRTILSKVAQLYDPLGLISPVIICAKISLQELWKNKLDWDDPVPVEAVEFWKDYVEQLKRLNEWSIPRTIRREKNELIEIHGFSDASEKAYGACLYLRVIRNGNYYNLLLCSNSRVAPLHFVTIPRLELCAALLLVRLHKAAVAALRLSISRVVFWTDSTIVLNWINTPSHELKTFVANRIAEIQEFTSSEEWKHVPTKENPAELISRGLSPSEFIESNLWKRGPEWLEQPEAVWPEQKWKAVEVPERRAIKSLTVKTIEKFELSERFSSWTVLVRVVAYCLRFVRFKKGELRKGLLSVEEFKSAELRILLLVQREAFAGEIRDLSSGGEVSRGSKLIRLSPMMEKGLLRVGGRIKYSNLNHDQKHQIILPKNHPITLLLIREYHERALHAGVNCTLYSLRQNYWIVDGRSAVKSCIYKCVKCARSNPKEFGYKMGNLPEVRLKSARPFENVGVDFCGYFFVKEKKYRNKNRIKIYVAVFVCMVTKAIHLEVVCDLTTDAFLACLRRFFARRGKCKALYSDNGTNFKGAKNELEELYSMLNSEKDREKITKNLAEQKIEWHFIPPRTPHFGGIWEAAARSFKHHLKRTIGETLLCYDEFETLVCEIEAILNSRPLTPMSSDPHDLMVLTPAHFLIGQSFQTVPSVDYSDIKVNRLSVWQHIQKMKIDFWKRWHTEYLNEITVKNKWHTGESKVEIGGFVLLKDDNQTPLRWLLGRIEKTYPGKDDIVRVVDVRTKDGVYKRGLKTLSPLPIEM